MPQPPRSALVAQLHRTVDDFLELPPEEQVAMVLEMPRREQACTSVVALKRY
jgi:hypothetical protein